MRCKIRTFSFILFVILFVQQISAQRLSKACCCPTKDLNETGKADKTFQLNNGKAIGLCGYLETSGRDTVYSEFALFECGKTKVFKFWDATEVCKIRQNQDSLFVEKLVELPFGANFSYKPSYFQIAKLYYQGNNLTEFTFFKDNLPKYSSGQIKLVLKQYNQLTKSSSSKNGMADKLFWAYVSGNEQAGKYLDTYESKFGPFDGHTAEEFAELWKIYRSYKKTR